MKNIILIAHGSRLETSNEEIITLVSDLNARFTDYTVNVAFLEFVSPTIGEALDLVFAQNNFKKVYVLPYFLAAGHHVLYDIPKEVDSWLSKSSDKQVVILPHIGTQALISSFLFNTITDV
jgi:sirohydrochlorin cobaltochelatase